MAGLQERLDQMEAAIHKPSFRESSGRANEVNYWVFDYDPAKELELAWEKEGKKNFQLCHKCGKWVIDAMYNADALECVGCAPWEDTPEFCKFCGMKVSATDSVCPSCGEHLIYGGKLR